MARGLQPFEFFEPDTLSEATTLLEGADAAALAGGVDLVLDMRLRNIAPATLVSLRKLPDLDYVKIDPEAGLCIGALATISAIAGDSRVRENWPTLHAACSVVGTPQIRNMSTLVGNVCAASPLSDIVPTLCLHNATASVTGPAGDRVIPVKDLVLGVDQTALTSGEIVTEILVPPSPDGAGAGFRRFLKTLRAVGDLPKVSVAAVVLADGSAIRDAQVWLGGVATVAFEATDITAGLQDCRIDEVAISKAVAAAGQEFPRLTDDTAIEEYRGELATVLIADTVTDAARLAKG